MIDLYYWPTPNGHKITVALEEMGLPYTIHPVNIGKGDQFEPAFLKIAPNNRMPAIVDGDISIFESGAILQYLARKTGQLYGNSERDKIAVEEWLMWQMGGVGPMAGQAHHFLNYAPTMDPPNVLPYAQDRYRNEVARLYGVLDKRLADNEFVAGDFLSIADCAIWPWAMGWEKQQQTLDNKPNLARWLDALNARPAFAKGRAVGADLRSDKPMTAEEQKILFGKR